MSVGRIIGQLCAPCSFDVHKSRAAAVEAVVAGIARANSLSPARVGRFLGGRALPKHSIKRVDRLLGNTKLHAEWELYYSALCSRVLRDFLRPVVIIDWSGTVKGLHTLAAAVAVQGRAVTIYAEVHREADYTNREVHAQFLSTLQRVIGPARTPVIVADAGFRAPFMNAVRALGWDFVTRVRGEVCVRRAGEKEWIRCRELHHQATHRPKDLGIHRLTKERRAFVTPAVDVRLVLAKKPKRQGAKRPTRSPRNGMRHGRGVVQAAREPWLLATSLSLHAAQVTKLYALRMQIEETFRDLKSHRFGWALRHVYSRSPARMTTLLMLGAIASAAVVILGMTAEALSLHRRYQANTIRRRRVLSHFFLGCSLLRGAHGHLTMQEIMSASDAHFRAQNA